MISEKLRLLSLYLSATLVIFAAISASVASAQVSNSISVNIAPPNPAPFENTTVTLNSYADNLDSVSISWSVNGKNLLSGIGKKSFSINAPAAGSAITVLATIALPSGVVTTSVVVKPSVMVLLWQANDSYVPPFYRGKALPTADSQIKVVAMPEIRNSGGLISPKNMTYAWQKDFTNLQDDSGYGKNSLVYINDFLEGTNNISVTASTVDQASSSQGSIDIGTVQPKIIFYKNDAGLGTMWENSLADSHVIEGKEIVQAAPYFISPKELLNPRLVWSWFINGGLVSIAGTKKNVIPLQAQAGVTGTSQLRLNIENQNKIFETTSREINIEF